MKKWAEIAAHTVPILALWAGAVFGLTTEEQNTLAQVATSVVGAILAVLPIYLHHTIKKAKASVPVEPKQADAPTPKNPS